MKNEKTAVILLNMGGPDSLPAVKPFLFNLFYDKAIIDLPNPLRFLLASLISTRREDKAKDIYRQIGGRSPILEQTKKQASALEEALNSDEVEEYDTIDDLLDIVTSGGKKTKRSSKSGETTGEEESWKVFVCMRYSSPRSEQVVQEVKEYGASRVILLPLYPQFSFATSRSSINDWLDAAQRLSLDVPTNIICSYATQSDFIMSYMQAIHDNYFFASSKEKPILLFSAHGLPEKNIRKGDPYQRQVEECVEEIVKLLAIDGLDYRICYQSKVGNARWLEPSTEQEILTAGEEGRSVIVVPISFVSEHSETLVELDIQYRDMALQHGVKDYRRIPTLQDDKYFISALANMCRYVSRNGEVGGKFFHFVRNDAAIYDNMKAYIRAV